MGADPQISRAGAGQTGVTDASPTLIPALTPREQRDAREALEAGRLLFAGPVDFALAAPRLEILPPATLPEIAFAGRSNVGKSSLLNALTGRHGLARTSTTPGRTQELIVFDVGAPPVLRLIDMPGYGFAEAPKDMIRQWHHLIGDYLRGRAVLKRVLLMVDCRHGFKPVDDEIMKLLDKAAVSYQIVLTKADKVKPTALAATIAAMADTARNHPAAHPVMIPTSSEKATGIAELRAAVAKAAFA
jgi:GTP-binding protein